MVRVARAEFAALATGAKSLTVLCSEPSFNYFDEKVRLLIRKIADKSQSSRIAAVSIAGGRVIRMSRARVAKIRRRYRAVADRLRFVDPLTPPKLASNLRSLFRVPISARDRSGSKRGAPQRNPGTALF
jgi:hypothetical protein